MKIKNQKHGFTLVELIVVLTILVILASLLIPSLTGYIRKAKEKTIITEATDVWKASQAALSECYAVYPESFTNPDPIKPPCRFATDIDGKRISNLGRITNAALNAVQINPNDQTEVNTSSRRITRQVYHIWIVLISLMPVTFSLYLPAKVHGIQHFAIILVEIRVLMLYYFKFFIRQMEKLLQSTLARMVIW